MPTDADRFATHPLSILRLFHVAHTEGLDIHPNALRLVTVNLKRIKHLTEDPEANRLFLDILCSKKNPEITLRRLNEAGVFGRFVPDFGRVVAQMQYDMYHVYTTDEHTIRAIGILSKIENGELEHDHPLASEVIHKVQSRRALYAAVFMHDIAKGRGGDHSELGAEIALTLGPRLGLTQEETETVSWLVLKHLVMSNIAFKRDIHDPKTIEDFVREVQSPERLRLLLVLTVVDIRAVGPTVWNAWKADLLRGLYFRAEDEISGSGTAAATDSRVRAAQAALTERLEKDWDKHDIECFVALGYPSYWLTFDIDALEHQARLVRSAEAEEAPLTMAWRIDEQRAATEITPLHRRPRRAVLEDRRGDVGRRGEHPRRQDRHLGQRHGARHLVDSGYRTPGDHRGKPAGQAARPDDHDPDRPTRFARRTGAAVQGRAAQPHRGVHRGAPRADRQRRVEDPHGDRDQRPRPAPAFCTPSPPALRDVGLQISTARISTFGERAVDVFYVKDVFGMKVDHQGKLRQIRLKLLEALGATPEEAETEVRNASYGYRSPKGLSRTTEGGKTVRVE